MATPGWFTRADGLRLEIVPGFRERVLTMPRTPVRPTVDWTEQHFRAAAKEKVRRVRRMLGRVRKHNVTLDGARALEIGCGPGLDALLVALLVPGIEEVVGSDLELPLGRDDRIGEAATGRDS
jgi:hypothetical protein